MAVKGRCDVPEFCRRVRNSGPWIEAEAVSGNSSDNGIDALGVGELNVESCLNNATNGIEANLGGTARVSNSTV